MTSDAPLPPHASMINGNTSHKEVEAATTFTPSTISLAETCADVNTRVSRFLHTEAHSDDELTRRTQQQVRTSLSVIEKSLQEYGFEGLSLSYNGGKDCLVLLLLYLSVLHTYFNKDTATGATVAPSTEVERSRIEEDPAQQLHATAQSSSKSKPRSTTFPISIPSIYAKPPDPFPQVTEFVASSSEDYHLDLVHISTTPEPWKKVKLRTSPPTTAAAAAAAASNLPDITTTNGSSTIPDASTSKHNHNHNHSSSHEQHQHQNQQQHPQTKRQDQEDPEHKDHAKGAKGGPKAEPPLVTFRDAFALYLSSHPSVEAIFVGTRRTDPHGTHLTHFDMTDGNWPRFMRVHPVIDWKLSEVWCFLRSPCLRDPRTGQRLNYCAMYDQGYTSLGGVNDTWRNPRLMHTDDSGRKKYRPAHELHEDEEERLGRE